MKRSWCNWQADKESLKNAFELSIKLHGTVEIKSVLDHVSASGMTRYISAFIPILDDRGRPFMYCIAREKRV